MKVTTCDSFLVTCGLKVSSYEDGEASFVSCESKERKREQGEEQCESKERSKERNIMHDSFSVANDLWRDTQQLRRQPLHFGFRVSGFGFRVSGFGFRV